MSNAETKTTAREPVTRRTHSRPWAADLETESHANNQKFIVEEARDAVIQTRLGHYVDLFAHKRHGHPATYLYESLETMERELEIRDYGRCSCGGYVSRVIVRG